MREPSHIALPYGINEDCVLCLCPGRLHLRPMNDVSRKNARRRALRAAQVVTLGLALAGGGGCYADHGGGVGVDAAVAMDDAGEAVPGLAAAPPVRVSPADAGFEDRADAGEVADAGDAALADAAPAELCAGESWAECCDAIDWPCDGANSWGCCAWGPYSPPEEGALPAPRSVSQRVVA